MPGSPEEFDPKRYWEERLEPFDLAAVGYRDFGTAFNGWVYRVRRYVFRRIVRSLNRLSRRERLMARFTYRHANLVCPVSELLCDSLKRLQPRGTYTVIPNAVDVDAFAAGERRGSGASGPSLITVAGLHAKKKGVSHLLDALRLLLMEFPDATLTIIGDGSDRPTLESMAVGLPVKFLGTRTRAEVVAMMKWADVFVAPSVLETFGIAPLEALSAGLPVVATSAYPVADTIAELGGLIVPPADSRALCEAVASVLAGRSKPRSDAAEELRRMFGLEANGRRWEEIYRSVLAKHNSSARTLRGDQGAHIGMERS